MSEWRSNMGRCRNISIILGCVSERRRLCELANNVRTSKREVWDMTTWRRERRQLHHGMMWLLIQSDRGKIPVRHQGNGVKFYALTMIDAVTNYVELQRVEGTAARAAAQAFETRWLFCYPRPEQLIHDQCTEFMGEGFQASLRQWGIRNAPIGVRNPQANAVCERMHQVVGNVLRTIIHSYPPQHTEQANGMVGYALQTAAYAV